MKVKLSQVLAAVPALTLLANRDLPKGDADAPKVAYRISKWLKKCVAESGELQEQRAKLIREYGHKVKQVGDDGVEKEVLTVKDENIEAYTAAMKRLLDSDTEIDGVVLVPFEDIAKFSPTAAMFTDLEFMISPPVEEAAV